MKPTKTTLVPSTEPLPAIDVIATWLHSPGAGRALLVAHRVHDTEYRRPAAWWLRELQRRAGAVRNGSWLTVGDRHLLVIASTQGLRRILGQAFGRAWVEPDCPRELLGSIHRELMRELMMRELT